MHSCVSVHSPVSIHLSVYVFAYLHIATSVSVDLYLRFSLILVDLSFYKCVHTYLHLTNCLLIYLYNHFRMIDTFMKLFVYQSIDYLHLSIVYLSIGTSIYHLSMIDRSIHISIYPNLSIHPSIHLSVYLSIYLPMFCLCCVCVFSVNSWSNEANE